MLFQRRLKQVDIAPFLRRIIDTTTPNLATGPDIERIENRYNRTFPVLVAGWTEKCTVAEPVIFAITRDISDNSISIVLSGELEATNVVIGVWASPKQSEHPWFFLGRCIRRQEFGGGFRLCAFELYEIANDTHPKQVQKLLPLAEQLLPAQ